MKSHYGFREDTTKDKATCKVGFINVNYPKAESSTNMIAHLKRKHNVEIGPSASCSKPEPSKNLRETQLKLTV